MHTPGVCGAILATGQPMKATGAPGQDEAAALGKLIDALADTDMVLVALAAGAESLAPVMWARAAYVVQLAPGASDAAALRALLQEALNRGRDAVLVTKLDATSFDATSPGGPALSAEGVRRMISAYRAAGEEIWAVVSEPEPAATEVPRPAQAFLLGREMIELFLRGQNWSTADEILSANREHVLAMKSSGADCAAAVPGKSGPG